MTVVLVEHHVQMIMTISDHITVLDHGRVIASGSAAHVQSNPIVVEAYLGHGPIDLRQRSRLGTLDQGRCLT